MLVRNATRGFTLGASVSATSGFWSRLRGLMFRPALGHGQGLWIRPCQAVHTHFMRFAIDVIFIDDDRRVCHVIAHLQPWRHTPLIRSAATVLELPGGAAGATTPGDLIECETTA